MVNRNPVISGRTNNGRHFNSDIHSSSSISRSRPNDPQFDDVIASLANATENRRARQVGEWERMRRQIFRAAA